MAKNKKKRFVFSENRRFVLINIAMGLLLAVSLAFSITDKCCGIIPWSREYVDVIGVSSQIITAIISLVVSIIGIAISLQNEIIFGTKTTTLYSLRVVHYYSMRATIIIAVLLCSFNMLFYMLGLIIAAIGTLAVAIIFLLYVVSTEIPIMTKSETAFLKILNDNMYLCYINEKEAPKELKTAIKYLLHWKNLNEIYGEFKRGSDEYDHYLLIKLLEYQHDLAFELTSNYGEAEQRVIADNLCQNVLDVILQHIKMTPETYQDICNNKYLLTRVLFRVHEIPSVRKKWVSKVEGLFQCLEFSSTESKGLDDLISDVLVILVVGTVSKGDFEIVKAIRRQLSRSDYSLTKDNPALIVFILISMYFYYLMCSEKDVPDELKQQIDAFIEESGGIEDETMITSWRKLFQTAAEEFSVNYADFIALCTRSAKSMEYFLYSNSAKFLVLNQYYFSNWYFTHLINARRVYQIDYRQLCTSNPDIKPFLKDFGQACLDEDGMFIPTDSMNRIVSVYSDSKEHFVFFRIDEERNHNFFLFINQLRNEELTAEVQQAKNVNHSVFANAIHNALEQAIKAEWGYDETLMIENESRYFSIIFEMMPDAYHFEETLAKYCVDSVFDDLEHALDKTIIYNNDHFEDAVRSALHRQPQYTTENAQKTIPYFYIHDDNLKEEYLRIGEALELKESRIIGNMFLVVGDSFKFNCHVEKVEITGLSEERIAKEVDSYQRADGQFVYKGVFLPRETVVEIVQSKYAVLTVVIKHQVISSADTVFELKPYSKGPKDD